MRLESFWRDLSFAVRTLSKSRMYAFVAIVAISLAIACNVAVGSVLDGVLLRPLPYPGADRLVNVGYDVGSGQFSYLDSRDYRTQQTTLQQFGIRTDDSATFGGPSNPVTLNGSQVDEGYFGVLGVRPDSAAHLRAPISASITRSFPMRFGASTFAQIPGRSAGRFCSTIASSGSSA